MRNPPTADDLPNFALCIGYIVIELSENIYNSRTSRSEPKFKLWRSAKSDYCRCFQTAQSLYTQCKEQN